MKRRKNRRRFRSDESGAVMVIAALGLVGFLSVASLVTDLGLRYYQKSRLQTALDSAALAAVTCLPDKNKAEQTALSYISKNGFDTQDVTVEFPDEGVVRVSDNYECKTLFANVFGQSDMNISAHAAAKYLNKNMSIDFDYLMYYDEDSTFNLVGDFREVAGSIFGNGNINVQCNDAAVIYDIVSARQVTYLNNMSTQPNTQSHAAKQKMPDWDEMIMSVSPEGDEDYFKLPASPISPSGRYQNKFTGNYHVASGKAIFANGMYVNGNLTTDYGGSILTISGDLYVTGDFFCSRPLCVTGNLYVGGNFDHSWGMSIYVGGTMYVGRNVTFQSTATVGGGLYAGGNISLFNGNGTVYRFGSVQCRGYFTSEAAWAAEINITGGVKVYGSLFLGGGKNIIKGDIKVWGKNPPQSGDTCYINGDMNLTGDVWCHQGCVAFGGNGDCVIQGFVYSGGSIETRSGGDMSLSGCMIAEGNILIGGASHTYNDSGATLSLYSRQGDITLGSQGTELKMWGIVYAPKGDIELKTDGLKIYGSLVANTITCNIGCGFYIGKNDRTLPFAKTIKAAALIE